MPWNPGGSKMNLVTGYSLGEDWNADYGKNRYYAQTFTLDDEYVLWRFRLKSWTNEGANFYHYDLYHTDALGKPTGAPIVSTTLAPTGESWYSPGEWRRFDFDSFPKLPAGLYAIVASVPDAAWFDRYKLRCDNTAAQYTLGKAWVSHDAGATWDELSNVDFMFEVWGYGPPPEPPPPPAISNWTSRLIEYEEIIDGYIVHITTDIPCHLYMRWSNVKPQKHIVPRYRRGIWMHDDVYLCFVAYHDNEQQEAGDTLTHTFLKPNWKYCETRYFHFWATVVTEPQPSTTALFEKHSTAPSLITLDALGISGYLYYTANTYQAARDFPTGMLQANSNLGTAGQALEGGDEFTIYRAGLYFDTSELPDTCEILEATLLFDVVFGGVFSAINDDDQVLTVVSGADLDPTGLKAADYGSLKAKIYPLGEISKWPWVGSFPGIAEVPLNAAGITQINRAGITRFALRGSHDINNIPDQGFIERNRYDFSLPRLDQIGWCWLRVKFRGQQ